MAVFEQTTVVFHQRAAPAGHGQLRHAGHGFRRQVQPLRDLERNI